MGGELAWYEMMMEWGLIESFGEETPWFGPWLLLELMIILVLGMFQNLEGSGKRRGLG